MKSFFGTTSRNSGSDGNSGPSTHESGNVAQSGEQEVLCSLEMVQETVQNAENEDQSSHQLDVEGIRVFNPDVHVASDPGLRVAIEQFHPNIRDDVRRAYLVKGPTKPFGHNFPQNPTNKRMFVENWLTVNDWLEYSIKEDAAYCFYCFLFKQQPLEKHFGHDAFTKVGYRNWKNAYQGLPQHVGGANSCHNRARTACVDFQNRRASVEHKVENWSVDAERKYETRVTASLDVAGYLIAQAHAFRGHDESDSSLNRGNFLEMIEWHKKRNDEVRLAFEELCPLNAQMLSPDIQKDLCSAFAREVKKVIKKEIGDKLFSVLIDESRDISIAEQMAVIVRLVTI